MTARLEDVETELGDLATRRIESGDWPWTFFCYPEEQPRPVFPSVVPPPRPRGGSERLGLAVRCPACEQLSLNLVSHDHVDLPFHHDGAVGVVEHVFARDALRTVEEFTAELYSTSFDARRLSLD